MRVFFTEKILNISNYFCSISASVHLSFLRHTRTYTPPLVLARHKERAYLSSASQTLC